MTAVAGSAAPGGSPTGALTEYLARRLVADAERQLAARARRGSVPAPTATFRELAHAWPEHLQHVEDAKPSTLATTEPCWPSPASPTGAARAGRSAGS